MSKGRGGLLWGRDKEDRQTPQPDTLVGDRKDRQTRESRCVVRMIEEGDDG
jgi:hypothetical protein